MSIPKDQALKVISTFDVFKKMSAGLDRRDLRLETAGKGEKLKLKCVEHTFKKDGAPTTKLQDPGVVRAELKKSIEDVLSRTEARLYVDVFGEKDEQTGKGLETKVGTIMTKLKNLVNEKLSVSTERSKNNALTTHEVEKAVLSVELLIESLKEVRGAEFVLKTDEDLQDLVEKAMVKETSDRITTDFQRNYDKKLEEYNLVRSQMNPADSDKKKGEDAKKLASISNELIGLKRDRLLEGLENPAYCKKFQDSHRNFNVVTCKPIQAETVDNLEHAADVVKLENIGGPTSAIVNELAKRGTDNIIFVRICSDQKLFLGMFIGTASTQEEANAQDVNPDPFLDMYHQGVFRKPQAGEKQLQYVRQDNLLPKLDVVSGTLVDVEYEHSGNERLDKPNKARFFLAAELSFASKILDNQDLLGHLVWSAKFHEEVNHEASSSDDIRNQRISNQNKLIERFFQRQRDAVEPAMARAKKEAKGDKKLYKQLLAASPNFGGMTEDQYKAAIKIMDFGCAKFNGFKDGELTDRDIDAKLDEVVRLAKEDPDACREADENYKKALHHVYAARVREMVKEVKAAREKTGNQNLMGDYVATSGGAGVFKGDAKIIDDIETYEFIRNSEGCLNFVNAVFVQGEEKAVLNPDVKENPKIMADAFNSNLKKITAEKSRRAAIQEKDAEAKAAAEMKIRYLDLIEKDCVGKTYKEALEYAVDALVANSPEIRGLDEESRNSLVYGIKNEIRRIDDAMALQFQKANMPSILSRAGRVNIPKKLLNDLKNALSVVDDVYVFDKKLQNAPTDVFDIETGLGASDLGNDIQSDGTYYFAHQDFGKLINDSVHKAAAEAAAQSGDMRYGIAAGLKNLAHKSEVVAKLGAGGKAEFLYLMRVMRNRLSNVSGEMDAKKVSKEIIHFIGGGVLSLNQGFIRELSNIVYWLPGKFETIKKPLGEKKGA